MPTQTTDKRFTNRRHAGLASYASTVAMGPSRTVTSHARRIYHRRYEGSYRFPRLMFLFDGFLVCLVMVLLALHAWIILRPVAPPTLNLSFASQPLVAGAPVALVARLSAADGQAHHNTSLQWHLPPGTEVLSAQPPVSPDGSVFIGDVQSFGDRDSHLVVRLFQTQGSDVRIGFTVRTSDVQTHEFTGLETRPIASSGLNADIVDEFRADVVSPHGVVIPLAIENTTDVTLPFVQTEVRQADPSSPLRVTLGDLAPHEQRFLFIPLGDVTGTVSLTWSVSSAARVLSNGTWAATVRDWDAPQVMGGTLVSRQKTATDIHVTGLHREVGRELALVMVHPLLVPTRQVFDLSAGSGTEADLKIQPIGERTGTAHEWLVAPVSRTSNGPRLLGPASLGVSIASFPFTARVRYTSTAGDQLGVGPHPPQVGMETRYWVFWTIGPTDNALRDIEVETSLPEGVRTTGNISSPSGGTSQVSDQMVHWSLPSVDAKDGTYEATFGFEIQFVPRADQAGKPMLLVSTSTASAKDIQTSVRFESEAGPQTKAYPDGPDASPGGRFTLKIAPE